MTDPRTSVENLRDRIDVSEQLTDADRELLFAFSERLDLLSNEYGDYRHLKLLGHCFRIATGLDGPVLEPALTDRTRAEDILAWINDTYGNEETNRDYRTAIRVFGKRVTEGDDTPDSLDWIPTGTSKTYDPSPDPRDMLRWEHHVVPMAESAANARDAALVTLQFDAGLRGSELYGLTVGDLQDHEYGQKVTVEGKTGRRSVLLVPSVPYVQEWQRRHPAADDSGAPFWCDLGDGHSRITRQRVYQVLNRLAELAGVDRPVTPTNFRKSSAAYLARHNLNQVHIEDHHGWVRGSRVAARYIAVFGDATDREVARVHGVDVDETERESIGPVTCPRCGQETPTGRDFCLNCNQALKPGAANLVEELTAILDERLVEADDAETRQDLVTARRTTATNPGMLNADELHRVLNSLSD